ncbi:hypothetical protein HMPREF3293_03112 [Christensenella minuta]|uniref:Uncharacterized protein n=1 Tax=Christensenella minuta TaxID=626937 RepID=A0A136Q0I2_9FIRM|nr:hypothetical protein HMPREF3293_03112 [Christensenella minuta]
MYYSRLCILGSSAQMEWMRHCTEPKTAEGRFISQSYQQDAGTPALL